MKDPPISALYPYQSSYVPRAIDIMNWNFGTLIEIYPFILLSQSFIDLHISISLNNG